MINFFWRQNFEQSDYFSLYTDYCSKFDESVKELMELKKNAKWNSFLQVCHNNPHTKRQKIDSFLIKPVQRVTKCKKKKTL